MQSRQVGAIEERSMRPYTMSFAFGTFAQPISAPGIEIALCANTSRAEANLVGAVEVRSGVRRPLRSAESGVLRFGSRRDRSEGW